MKLSTMFQGPAPLPSLPVAAPAPPPKPEPTGATGLFSPAEANKYAMMAAGFHALERQLQAIAILTPEDAANVQRGLADVVRAHSTCEEARLAQTKPHRDNVAKINEAWRPVVEGLDKLKRMANSKILGWNEAERQRKYREEQAARKAAEEALREAETARAAADADGGTAAEQTAQVAEIVAQAQLATVREVETENHYAPRGIRTEAGTTSSVWAWTFRVTNEADIPREFLVLDEAKVRAAIKAGRRDVPGLTIYEEERLRTVTR